MKDNENWWIFQSNVMIRIYNLTIWTATFPFFPQSIYWSETKIMICLYLSSKPLYLLRTLYSDPRFSYFRPSISGLGRGRIYTKLSVKHSVSFIHLRNLNKWLICCFLENFSNQFNWEKKPQHFLKSKCTAERNILKGSKLTSDTASQDNLHQLWHETLKKPKLQRPNVTSLT